MVMPAAGQSEYLKRNKGVLLTAVHQPGKSGWNRKKQC
jgi:hypothetical protein